MKRLAKNLLIFLSLALASHPAMAAQETFNDSWLFHQGAAKGAEAPGFDTSTWRELNLPHDWAIEGPFDIDLDGSTGKLPWAQAGWYRKTFSLPKDGAGKRVFLDIDGAMANATVFVNGKEVGGRPYGYMPFRVDLTDALKFGGENVLAIRLDTEKWGSRWYPGAGLYRNVWLIKKNPVFVPKWGVHVQTEDFNEQQGTAAFDVTVENASAKPVTALVQTRVYEYGTDAVIGREVAQSQPTKVEITAGSTSVASTKAKIPSPKLWDIDDPQRYLSVTDISVGGKLVDRFEQPFGFRSLKFTARDGFFLNGRKVPIQGVCMHHDLGPLGAAFNTRAFERQMEIMKEMGVNAIRTSHNPPAPEVLEVCDRLGLLVQVETFDCWRGSKRRNDYSVLFDEWHERDLRDIVLMGRNHPSVFMWCLGNEVTELKKNVDEAIEIVKALDAIVKRYDTSRPTTVGSNTPAPATNGFQKHFDVFGFNYFTNGYPRFVQHKDNQDRGFHGSETASTVSSRGEYFFPVFDDFQNQKSAGVPTFGKKEADRKDDASAPVTGANFQMSSYDVAAPGWGATPDYMFMELEKNPAAMGEFVWTGFDYLGEPTPYNSDITNLLNFTNQKERARMEKELDALGKIKTPSRSSYFGIVDLAGFKKDRFYLYQSRWRPDLPMTHILPHWNWPERIGEVTPVHVYTSGDKAELFLNGQSLGRKKKGKFEYRLRWNDVVYQPGELKVVAYKDGKIWAEAMQQTTGMPASVQLKADHSVLKADGRDLAFVTVSLEDAEGRHVPGVNNRLDFSVSGPGKIVAVCNGDSTNLESFQSLNYPLFNGLALVVVQTEKGTSGDIVLQAKSTDLKSA